MSNVSVAKTIYQVEKKYFDLISERGWQIKIIKTNMGVRIPTSKVVGTEKELWKQRKYIEGIDGINDVSRILFTAKYKMVEDNDDMIYFVFIDENEEDEFLNWMRT